MEENSFSPKCSSKEEEEKENHYIYLFYTVYSLTRFDRVVIFLEIGQLDGGESHRLRGKFYSKILAYRSSSLTYSRISITLHIPRYTLSL